MKLINVLFLSLLFVIPAHAVEAPILDSSARFHPVISRTGMVVSQEQVASQVGADILAKGGNAIDAAVATGFALAVTLPRAGNIGGGGFMLVYLAEEDRTVAIDYREMAPSAAFRDLFLDETGGVDNQKARFSIFSSGIPGTVAGLIHAQEKYGQLSLKMVMQPAITLADQGITVSHDLSQSLASRSSVMKKNLASAGYFYKPDGNNYQEGERLRQKDLAGTLKRIARQGLNGFYGGKTADLIVAEMQRNGGLITHQDLKDYRVVEREPVCGTFRENKICAMPPPSSGGVHLIQMLNILEGWNLQTLGHNSSAYLHRLIESMRRAYADRSKYLGDPDFYSVPVRALTDKQYAEQLRRQIDLMSSSRSSDILPGLGSPKESMETTHYSTWDQWGNVVSNTYTLNFSYGSGISVAGAGFLLNNEMDDFSSKPGVPNAYGLVGAEANAIEPKKRPLSSMTPTIVFNHEEKPVLATGSPGGSTIITVVLQMLLNVLEFDMNVAEATAAPRIHHQWLPDTIFYEKGISQDTLDLLTQRGHKLAEKSRILGATQTISANKDGVKFGAADYRRSDAAAISQ